MCSLPRVRAGTRAILGHFAREGWNPVPTAAAVGTRNLACSGVHETRLTLISHTQFPP
jgi:hypothetical protein